MITELDEYVVRGYNLSAPTKCHFNRYFMPLISWVGKSNVESRIRENRVHRFATP